MIFSRKQHVNVIFELCKNLDLHYILSICILITKYLDITNK